MQRENFAAHYPAPLYDRYSEGSLSAYDNWVIRRLTQVFQRISPEAILLDIGTGTARLLCKIARHSFFSQLKLVGLDYFSEMVSIAKTNVKSFGLAERITIEQADVHDLSFESGGALRS
jgi:ubiquinone/menaquinone biosynthesis C-methylase UbiE